MRRMSYFTPALFTFLRSLRRHNDRDWFAANKERYERDVRDPLIRFIEAAAKPLRSVSREIVADPRPVGGSMFRIYRDTRFSADKSPFKTHAAAHFRHRAGKDVHAPGYYLHLAPGEVFAGAGVWRPDTASLLAIREAIAGRSREWTRATSSSAFRKLCVAGGERSSRPPRGFDPQHPLIDELKRKEFVAGHEWTEADAVSKDFLDRFIAFCRAASPMNRFLASALGKEW
jgi:uncharacterized protein (TIGR02453 family)